jgi:hypothetical protein
MASSKKASAPTKANGSAREQAPLSVDELLSQPDLTVLEIPELSTATHTKIVHLRPLSAGVVIDMVVDGDNKPSGDSLRTLISHSVVHPDGTPMFDEENVERLREMRLDVFNRISAAVMKNLAPPTIEGDGGKAESSGDASPTDLPSN